MTRLASVVRMIGELRLMRRLTLSGSGLSLSFGIASIFQEKRPAGVGYIGFQTIALDLDQSSISPEASAFLWKSHGI